MYCCIYRQAVIWIWRNFLRDYSFISGEYVILHVFLLCWFTDVIPYPHACILSSCQYVVRMHCDIFIFPSQIWLVYLMLTEELLFK